MSRENAAFGVWDRVEDDVELAGVRGDFLVMHRSAGGEYGAHFTARQNVEPVGEGEKAVADESGTRELR